MGGVLGRGCLRGCRGRFAHEAEGFLKTLREVGEA